MNDEIKEILDRLEIVARKHTIRVCDDGSKIETMPASVVDELRLNNFSAKLLLDYITNLQTIEQQYSAILSENAELENKITNLEQENENYFKKNNELSTLNTSLRSDRDNYKSRIDKAQEKIKSKYIAQGGLTSYEVNDLLNELENTLTGGDEE